VVQTFGIDQYRIINGREYWRQYWWNDTPQDGNWPVFIEAVAVPLAQAPRNWQVLGGLIDSWPRFVYYGGPCSRSAAAGYQRAFENWAASMGYAYETSVVAVQPNVRGMAHPNTNFIWYVANESAPQTRYRFIRPYGGSYFHWADQGYDTFKYGNYYDQNH